MLFAIIDYRWSVPIFAFIHAVLWTLILSILKGPQDVHMDVAEAFAWGQKIQLGYGKHPPLSGWIAGVWFKFFPVADWAAYALATATIGCGLVICWRVALRVVDRRRAFFTVLMLAIYPIFNFKGFKYNPDLLQLVTLPLLVLAYLDAFEKRTVRAGLWLGLAGALALMTKYWVLTMIGAIGISALVHPERLKFLRSPAPWVAIATLLVVVLPHLWWLKQVDFVPLTYAGDVYEIASRLLCLRLVLGYIGHNLALLAVPVLLAALALTWRRPLTRAWRFGATAGANTSQALNVWIIQGVVALGPPLGALAFVISMKTDWGISLFFLVPLSLVAIPSLSVSASSLLRLIAIWLIATLGTLAAAPFIASYEANHSISNTAVLGSRSILADQLTNVWHTRFNSRWAVVAATTEIAEHMAFYSPDHPAPFTPGELWTAGLTSLEEARLLGFLGVCDPSDPRAPTCRSWMNANAAGAERLTMTTQRSFFGMVGPANVWEVYVVPPALNLRSNRS